MRPTGGYRLTGRKSWATLCLSADFHTVNATVTDPDGHVPDDPELRATREMMFVIPRGMSYRRGHILERLFRDARSGPFHPLTTDQTLECLGRAELGLLDPVPD